MRDLSSWGYMPGVLVCAEDNTILRGYALLPFTKRRIMKTVCNIVRKYAMRFLAVANSCRLLYIMADAKVVMLSQRMRCWNTGITFLQCGGRPSDVCQSRHRLS